MGGAGRKSGIGESAPWDPKGLVLQWESACASDQVEISLSGGHLVIMIEKTLGDEPPRVLLMRRSDVPRLAEYFTDLAKAMGHE